MGWGIKGLVGFFEVEEIGIFTQNPVN